MKRNIFKINDCKYAITTGDVEIIEFSGNEETLLEILKLDDKLENFYKSKNLWLNTIHRIQDLEKFRKKGNKVITISFLIYLVGIILLTLFMDKFLQLFLFGSMGLITCKTIIFLVCGSKCKNMDNLEYAKDRYKKFDKESKELENKINGLIIKNDYEVISNKSDECYEYMYTYCRHIEYQQNVESRGKVRRLTDKK